MYYHSNSTRCLCAGTSPCCHQLCDSPVTKVFAAGRNNLLPDLAQQHPEFRELSAGERRPSCGCRELPVEGPEQHRHNCWGTSKCLTPASCPR